MRVLICDDDQRFLRELERMLKREFSQELEMCLCQNREEFQKILSRECAFELILMDICLEEENGIQLAREILQNYPNTAIIFITGYPDLYYERIFLSVRPYGFVKKPVNWKLLTALIRKKQQELGSEEINDLFIKTREGQRKVSLSDIRYLESQGHLILIHTKNEVYEIYGKLTQLEELLPEYFLYCHKSFIVNANYIQTYESKNFVLKDGTMIKISQARQKETRKKFFQYLDQEKMRF